MEKPVTPKFNNKRIPFLSFIPAAVIAIAGLFLLQCCDIKDYQYYIRTNELKPLLITIVDQSGSMNDYKSSTMNLVKSSLDILVDELYDGDLESMEQHTFVVGCDNGEWWPRALCTPPSDLMPTPGSLLVSNEVVRDLSDEEYTDFIADLDAYPVRVYLFYGNGGTPDTTSTAFTSNYDSFISDYESLLINKAVVVAVPGSTEAFIEGTENVISGTLGMQAYGWQLQEYDPNTLDMNVFAENLISIVSE